MTETTTTAGPSTTHPRYRMLLVGIISSLLLSVVAYFGLQASLALEACRRMGCESNLRQLSLAVLNYEATYQAFPPAYTVDREGNRLHSWRVLILPFLERHDVYAKIDLSKAWDHPDNAVPRQIDIPQFWCPSALSEIPKCQTTIVAFADPRGIMTGPIPKHRSEFLEDVGNHMMLYETSIKRAVHWMEPTDGDLMELNDTIARSTRYGEHFAHSRGTHVVFGDMHGMFLSTATTLDQLKAIVNGE